MNIPKLIVPLIFILLLSGCASQFKPGMGSYGDAASTFYALDSGDFVEANPVFAWIDNPAGIALAITGAKWGAKHFLHDGLGVDAYSSDTIIETSGVAVTGWNVALILGASNPVGAVAAIGGGWLYYTYRKNNIGHKRYEHLTGEAE